MAYEIKDKSTGQRVYYYEGNRQTFGGPWADPDKFDHLQIPDEPPIPDIHFGMKELLEHLINVGTNPGTGKITPVDLPQAAQDIIT